MASSLYKAGTVQHRQMVWVRQARRKGVTKVNQHLKASQARPTSSNLMDMGWVVTRIGAYAPRTLRRGDVARQEATENACGVTVAKSQGHSWAPTLSSGSRVNVGTISVIPSPVNSQFAGGKVRRQLMLSRWDGGPVVVRGRESRLHGEGVQRDCGIYVRHGVRW